MRIGHLAWVCYFACGGGVGRNGHGFGVAMSFIHGLRNGDMLNCFGHNWGGEVGWPVILTFVQWLINMRLIHGIRKIDQLNWFGITGSREVRGPIAEGFIHGPLSEVTHFVHVSWG